MIKLTDVSADRSEGVVLINVNEILSVASDNTGSFIHMGDKLYHSVKETSDEIEKIMVNLGIRVYDGRTIKRGLKISPIFCGEK